MYNPRDVFTKEGYEDYKTHLRNIYNALNYINNHYDDLHIGALSGKQEEMWFNICGNFNELYNTLLTGDGETDEK